MSSSLCSFSSKIKNGSFLKESYLRIKQKICNRGIMGQCHEKIGLLFTHTQISDPGPFSAFHLSINYLVFSSSMFACIWREVAQNRKQTPRCSERGWNPGTTLAMN